MSNHINSNSPESMYPTHPSHPAAQSSSDSPESSAPSTLSVELHPPLPDVAPPAPFPFSGSIRRDSQSDRYVDINLSVDPSVDSPVIFKDRNRFKLSKRGFDVLQQLALGKTSKEIGCELNIAEKTVKWYLSSIFEKFNVKSRFQLIHICHENPELKLKIFGPKAP